LCDSVLTPAEYEGAQTTYLADYTIPSTVGRFHVPRTIVAGGELPDLATLLEECVAHEYTSDQFLARARRRLSGLDTLAESTLVSLFGKIADLERAGQDGLWARILKNAFAPVFAGSFDYVVGNPPWVNWESLSDEYRQATGKLWQDYGLFSLKGHAARLGGGKKDLAMLLLYVAADHYLRDGGRLAFVVTQTLFKSEGAGAGFRRFQLGAGTKLNVLRVQDMSELQPFEGATNRTATVLVEKGAPTSYPVPYTLWRKRVAGRVAADLPLSDVRARTTTTLMVAQPIDAEEPSSPWITSQASALDALGPAVGRSSYRAHAGACTWKNGVFWLRILARRPDGLLVVENLHDVGRQEVPLTQAVVEPDLIFPLLRGRDVTHWGAIPSAHILVSQDPKTQTGYDEEWLKIHLPHSYAYLKRFESLLRTRSGYLKYFEPSTDPFYTIYNVSTHTFAQHKVVWREQASDFTASAVLSDGSPVVPDHKLMLVACATRQECHYLSALLNSAISRLIVGSYVVATSTSTHVLEHVAIPQHDPENELHRALARLGERAYLIAAQGAVAPVDLSELEAQVDEHAAALWGIESSGLAAVREALGKRGPKPRRRDLQPRAFPDAGD
jgi:hypothetical protein